MSDLMRIIRVFVASHAMNIIQKMVHHDGKMGP